MGNFIQAGGGIGNLRGAMRLLVSGSPNLLGKFINLCDHAGDFLQRAAEVAAQGKPFIHNAGALFHVVHRFAGFFLDALDQLRNFACGLGRFFCQLTHFISNYGKSQAMFTGARGFNRGIERQQVGLLGQIVNHLNDLADVVGALSQDRDDLRRRTDCRVDTVQAIRGLFHGGDAAVHFVS